MREVRVSLKGGIGNQIFQYGAGLNLAKRLDVSLKLCVRSELGFQSHLDYWGLSSSKRLSRWDSLRGWRIRNALEESVPPKFLRLVGHYAEEHFGYNRDFELLDKPVHIHGYFQSERYLRPVEGLMKERFFSENVREAVKAEWDFLHYPTRYVGVHVRGGDYLSLPDVYASMSQDYYAEALKRLSTAEQRLPLVCFTNDLEFAKQVFGQADFFIGPKLLSSPQTDLIALALSDAIIGANSTFSWIAAWLSSDRASSRIFPKRWFVDRYLQQRFDLIVREWSFIA